MSNVIIQTQMYTFCQKVKIDDERQVTKVADGGALLWCCNWKRGETFENIFEMFANFSQFLKINTVLFDGYSLSTKYATH